MRRRSYTNPDVNQRVKDVLQDLCEESGNVANAFRGEYGKTSCLTFQTKHMRRMLKMFPEIVCVDAKSALVVLVRCWRLLLELVSVGESL